MNDFDLYNYMPIQYLQSLLEKGLYFRYASLFEDENEGYIPEDKFEGMNCLMSKIALKMGVEYKGEIKESVTSFMQDGSDVRRKSTLVNCWHRNEKFNEYMWGKYACSGVYIKTNSNRFICSIPQRLHCLLEGNGFRNAFLHKVNYVSSHNKIDMDVATDLIMSRREHTIKLKKYYREIEYRLIVSESVFKIRTGIILNSKTELMDAEDLLTEIMDGDISLNMSDRDFEGFSLKVDGDMLIDEIGIVSNDNLDMVNILRTKYSIKAPIRVISRDYKSFKMIE